MTKLTKESADKIKDLIKECKQLLEALADDPTTHVDIIKSHIEQIRVHIPEDLHKYFQHIFQHLEATKNLDALDRFVSQTVTKSPDEQAEAFDSLIESFKAYKESIEVSPDYLQGYFEATFNEETLFAKGIELTPELRTALEAAKNPATAASFDEVLQKLQEIKNGYIDDPYSIEIMPHGSPEHQEAYRKACASLEAAAKEGADLETITGRNTENSEFKRLAELYQTEMLSTLEHKHGIDTVETEAVGGQTFLGSERYVSDFRELISDELYGEKPLNLMFSRLFSGNLDTFFELTKSYEPGKVVPINFFKVNGLQLAQSGGVDPASQNAYFATAFDSGVGSIINMIKGQGPEAANSLASGETLTIADKEGEGKLTVQCTAVEDGTAELGEYGKPVIKKYRLTRTETDGSTTAREVVYIEAETDDTEIPNAQELKSKSELLRRTTEYLKKKGALDKGCISNCSEGMNRSASANVALAYDHLLTKTIRGLQERFPHDHHVLHLEKLRERLKTPVNLARPSYTEGDLLADKLRLYMNGEIIKSYKGREQNRFIARELVEEVINKEITLSISRMSAEQVEELIDHYNKYEHSGSSPNLTQEIANALSQRIKSLGENDLKDRLMMLCDQHQLERPSTTTHGAEEGIAAGAGGPSAADAPSKDTALGLLSEIKEVLSGSSNKSESLSGFSDFADTAYSDDTMLLAQFKAAVAEAQRLLRSARDTPVENILNIFRQRFNEVLPADQQIAADTRLHSIEDDMLVSREEEDIVIPYDDPASKPKRPSLYIKLTNPDRKLSLYFDESYPKAKVMQGTGDVYYLNSTQTFEEGLALLKKAGIFSEVMAIVYNRKLELQKPIKEVIADNKLEGAVIKAIPKPLKVTPEIAAVFKKGFEEVLPILDIVEVDDPSYIAENGALQLVKTAVDDIISDLQKKNIVFSDTILRSNIENIAPQLKDPTTYREAINSLINTDIQRLCIRRLNTRIHEITPPAPEAPALATPAAAPAPVAASVADTAITSPTTGSHSSALDFTYRGEKKSIIIEDNMKVSDLVARLMGEFNVNPAIHKGSIAIQGTDLSPGEKVELSRLKSERKIYLRTEPISREIAPRPTAPVIAAAAAPAPVAASAPTTRSRFSDISFTGPDGRVVQIEVQQNIKVSALIDLLMDRFQVDRNEFKGGIVDNGRLLKPDGIVRDELSHPEMMARIHFITSKRGREIAPRPTAPVATSVAAPAPVAAAAPQDSATIKVKSITGQVIDLSVKKDILISDLITQIRNKFGHAPDSKFQDELIWKGKKVEPSSTLADSIPDYNDGEIRYSRSPKKLQVTAEIEEIFAKEFKNAKETFDLIKDDPESLSVVYSVVEGVHKKILSQLKEKGHDLYSGTFTENIQKLKPSLVAEEPAKCEAVIQSLLNADYSLLFNSRVAIDDTTGLPQPRRAPVPRPIAAILAEIPPLPLEQTSTTTPEEVSRGASLKPSSGNKGGFISRFTSFLGRG